MKIYFITPKLDFVKSGGSTSEYDLTYRTLQKLGQEVVVITTTPERNRIPHELPYTVITEAQVPLNRGQVAIQKGVYKVLRKYESDADIFHIDGQVYLYGAGLYRLLGGKIPVFAYFNRELTAWPENFSPFLGVAKVSLYKEIRQKLRIFIERYIGMPIANRIDYFTITNPYLLKAYTDFGFKADNKHAIIGDPFDYKQLMSENNVTEHSYRQRNKKEGTLTLYASGRMAPGKGFDLLLTALSKVKHKDQLRLVIGGTGPEESKIHQLAKDLDLEQYVEFPGWVTKEQVHLYYSTIDIFIQPRWRPELISIILMEAMSFGLPIILPANGGLQWVTSSAALAFEHDNPDDLAEKIERLVSDSSLREQLSEACYVRLKDDALNYEKNIANMLQVMQTTCSAKEV